MGTYKPAQEVNANNNSPLSNLNRRKLIVVFGCLAFIVIAIGGVYYGSRQYTKNKNKPVPTGEFNRGISAKINADVPYEKIESSIKNADQAKQAGEFYVGRQKYADAEKAFLKAVELKGGSAELYSLLAFVYERQDKIPAAKTAYQKAADLYKQTGNTTAADSTIAKMKELDREPKDVLDLE